jgi:hypothetical protein
MSRIEGITTMEAENQLMTDLIDFNTKYANYVQCTNSLNVTNLNAEGDTCSTIDKSLDTVQTAYNNLITYTTDGTNTINGGDIYRVMNTFSDADNITQQQYDFSYNYIKNTYNTDITNLRYELDQKLNELYGKDTILNDYKNNYDLTIYTGLIWTILATTGLYFVFTKL